MTATEELRCLLDERGVRWRDSSDKDLLHTMWDGMDCWFDEFPDGWTAWGMTKRGTPAQAVEATLGRGECRVDSSHGFTDPYTQTRYEVALSCGHTLASWDDREPPSFCPWCGARVVG